MTSLTANFTSSDVGKVIVATYFPAGTRGLFPRPVPPSCSSLRRPPKPRPPRSRAGFSILARNPGGAAFRVLKPRPTEGVMVVPWDPIAKAKWKEFIVALAAKYDDNPLLRYLVMTGFQKTGECYLASGAGGHRLFRCQCRRCWLRGDRQTASRVGCLGSHGQGNRGAIHDLIPQYSIAHQPGPDPTAGTPRRSEHFGDERNLCLGPRRVLRPVLGS